MAKGGEGMPDLAGYMLQHTAIATLGVKDSTELQLQIATKMQTDRHTHLVSMSGVSPPT